MAGLALPVASISGALSAVRDAVDNHFTDPFSLSAALDADRYVLESGLLASPNSLDFEDDYLAGDSATFVQTSSAVDLFDITEFLNDEVHGSIISDSNTTTGAIIAADPESVLDLNNPEAQVSSENLNLQPHSGASAYGCDDGGIAVSV
jgi:transcriptional activator HAC1